MNRRDIVLGVIILAILGGIVYFWRTKAPKEEITIPQTLSTEEKLEQSFGLTIPDNLEKAELSGVGGYQGSAIATRNFENGTFEHTVLADLPDPEVGKFYEGWLVRGEPEDGNFEIVPTGRLGLAKGGYILEFSVNKDLSDHNKVVITLEEVADTTPEIHVLEGSF
jgi:hypothetical protein